MAGIIDEAGIAGIGGVEEAGVGGEELSGVGYVLQAIGFEVAGERVSIMEAGLNQFEDFRYLVEKDIRDMADEFGKRTQANGRIVFGLGRTKKLTGVMHWVQDCYQEANDVPDHGNFKMAPLYQAMSLAQIRKLDIELVTTNTKARCRSRKIQR